MALKKSELYSSLWKSCDELRGGMDASQYKDYVLVLLFMKYVSDKYIGQKNALLTVPEGGGFRDMVKLKGDKEIGDKINKIIGKLAAANDLKGVIDVADFNNADKLGKGKEMVDRLSNLVAIFDKPELDFRGNRAEGDDILGDAYEYLMRHFATESGKSKGQFYTPAEVSRIMAQVIGMGGAKTASQTIFDPTCGSGSLLLKAHDEALEKTGLDLTLYGQEMDNATTALAKMNMILHDCPTAEIVQDNTLSTPRFLDKNEGLKRHDFVVANPPFSSKAWSNGFSPASDLYGRFEYGIPPAKNGDYAFLLHVLASLKSDGKGAIILPHGVLFRGNVEAEIRREIVTRGFIKGIIGLPANLFYGTGIPACIIVLDKENAEARKGIFLIDASAGFQKDGNKNRLRSRDIHRIVDAFTHQTDIPRFSRMVPFAEIKVNDYNLNIPRYIDSSEPEDIQDIEAHLRGGIPERDLDALDSYWKVLPNLRQSLFKRQRTGYARLVPAVDAVKSAILEHDDFQKYNKTFMRRFATWKKKHAPALNGIASDDSPRALLHTLSEDLLDTFEKARLVDPYAVYQHLMDYWAAAMQDDVYFIVQNGWQAADENAPNLELIPRELIIQRYFKKEQAAIDKLEAEREAITARIEELDEEHSGEDGLLAEARNERGKLAKAVANRRLREIQDDPDAAEEREILEEYLKLVDQEAVAKKQAKQAHEDLWEKIVPKYYELTPDEVRGLVVDDKWLATLETAVHSELDRVSRALTGRIRELADRYAVTLPELSAEVVALSARVDEHLTKMGFTWK